MNPPYKLFSGQVITICGPAFVRQVRRFCKCFPAEYNVYLGDPFGSVFGEAYDAALKVRCTRCYSLTFFAAPNQEEVEALREMCE
jgi:hypothetical protein